MLWEAGRATSSTPLCFDKIKFQTGGAVFLDGVLLLNNPIRELVNEADQVWPNGLIGHHISIGTGCGKTGDYKNKYTVGGDGYECR